MLGVTKEQTSTRHPLEQALRGRGVGGQRRDGGEGEGSIGGREGRGGEWRG